VGRPRSFDEEKVLEAAAACFWARGYEATSVRDLSDSMGIAGASLYNAYGDKRALFAAALGQYCNTSMRERIMRIEASTAGIAAIDAFFADIIEKSSTDSERKGCLLVNAALEIAPSDGAFSALISGYFSELRGFFQRNIRAAQANRETPIGICAESYSAHLLCVLMGIRVLARSSPQRHVLEAATRPALQYLHPPANVDERGSND
jgi:TetR/AcrR family transcriptional regulator, transcriptional repressor for nem operon